MMSYEATGSVVIAQESIDRLVADRDDLRKLLHRTEDEKMALRSRLAAAEALLRGVSRNIDWSDTDYAPERGKDWVYDLCVDIDAFLKETAP